MEVNLSSKKGLTERVSGALEEYMTVLFVKLLQLPFG
jgi:hypothetical protein